MAALIPQAREVIRLLRTGKWQLYGLAEHAWIQDEDGVRRLILHGAVKGLLRYGLIARDDAKTTDRILAFKLTEKGQRWEGI